MNRNASPADQDDSPAPERDEAAGSPRRRATKFQYATGDRPLDGYTIKRGVGRGGFGEVYFATSDAGKEVALKLIRRNLEVELRGVRQCLNLKHNNLVGLYDIRSDDIDDEWVVMEYVDGESLEDIIDRHPNGMPVELAVEWLRGIAAGVGYLHRSGIVHRDLKPANLFLERTGAAPGSPLAGVVKIGDYGLSKFISASKRSGQTESVGTVHYMAPEIAGGRYGREIDLYALGVIFYEMLTGHVPFEGESVGEVLMKHLTAEPELHNVEEPYRTIVARALAKDPEGRLENVDEMIALLPGEPPRSTTDSIVLEVDESDEPRKEKVWRPVSNPPHTSKHHTRQGEPLWQGMVELSERVREGWDEWKGPPIVKGIVLFVVCWAAIFTSPAWVGGLMALIPIYLVYYIVWSIFFEEDEPKQAKNRKQKDPALDRETIAYRHKPSQNRQPRKSWREAALNEIRGMSTRLRVRSLVGSMLFASMIVIGLSVLLCNMFVLDTQADPIVLGVWLASVASLGSWGVLTTNALTEGRVEDRAPMRGLQFLFGLGLGIAAFALAATLGLNMPNAVDFTPGPRENLLEQGFDIDLYPGVHNKETLISVPLVASAGYYALLMTLCRWWKLAEYTRHRRIGFWSVVGCLLWAFVISLVWWYPQPTGLVVAGMIAIATQAASRWVPPSRRIELARNI